MSKKTIVILQRGWVVVGELMRNGADCILRNGAVIRKWGTTQGLGELARKGPLDDTILDPIDEMTFHELTVVGTIKCSEAWHELVLNPAD